MPVVPPFLARADNQDRADPPLANLAVLTHELRNLLATATLTFDSLSKNNRMVQDRTSGLLGKSLRRMRTLIDRTLVEVRWGAAHHVEQVSVAQLIEEIEIEIAAALEATVRQVAVCSRLIFPKPRQPRGSSAWSMALDRLSNEAVSLVDRMAVIGELMTTLEVVTLSGQDHVLPRARHAPRAGRVSPPAADAPKLAAMGSALGELEQEIARFWPRPRVFNDRARLVLGVLGEICSPRTAP